MLHLREVLLRLKDSLNNRLIRVAFKALPEEKLLGFIIDLIPLSVEWKQSVIDVLQAMAKAENCRIIDLIFSDPFIDLLDTVIALTHVDYPSLLLEGKEASKLIVGGLHNGITKEG